MLCTYFVVSFVLNMIHSEEKLICNSCIRSYVWINRAKQQWIFSLCMGFHSNAVWIQAGVSVICEDFTRSLLAGSGFKTGSTLGFRLYIRHHFLMHFNGINALYILCSLICVKYDSQWGEIDLQQLHTLICLD